MKCPKCNSVIAPGDVYCGTCGQKQSAETETPAATPRQDAPPPRAPSASRKRGPFIPILIISACILLAAGVKFSMNRHASSSGGSTPTPPVVNNGPKADYTVSAVDFLAEFARDEAAATAKYSGKWVDVRGWLSSCDTTDVGGTTHATTITLNSWCFNDLLLFKLNREEMDKRFLTIDYYELWRMMGRFSGREGKMLVFEKSVLMTTAPDYPPLPVEASADVAEVVHTMQDPDLLVRSKLEGRKIQVSGTISNLTKVDEWVSIITLAGEGEADRLSCEVPASKMATFEQGQSVTFKGWLICTPAMPDMGLSVSFDDPSPTPGATPMADAQAGGGSFQSSDLVGEWSGTARDRTVVKFDFRKDGTVIWDVSDPEFKKQFPSGLQAKYVLRATGELMEIDMDGFSDERFRDKRLLGILQATGKTSFKLEFNEHQENAPRPSKFSDEAIVFTKE